MECGPFLSTSHSLKTQAGICVLRRGKDLSGKTKAPSDDQGTH